MTKKQKVVIHRDEEFDALDSDLEAAMGRLMQANDKVGALLSSIDAGEPALPDGEHPAYAEIDDGIEANPSGEAQEDPPNQPAS